MEVTTPAVSHFDGGTRSSKPGPAAIGCTIEAGDWSAEASDHLGKATDNEAEYHALIRELEVAPKKRYIEFGARGACESDRLCSTADNQPDNLYQKRLVYNA